MEQAQTPPAPVVVQFPTPLFAEIIEAVGSIRPNREVGPMYKALIQVAGRANQNGVFAPTTPLTTDEFQNIEKYLNDQAPKYVSDVITKLETFVNTYNEEKRLEAEAAAKAAEEAKAAADAADPKIVSDASPKEDSVQ